jgi:centrosomal protein CEP104
VRQIQFLSHQFKITTKIEILIFNPLINSSKFKKIGYLQLDSNEKSNFQARELKSVYIDYECQRMKIILHRCYTNVHNKFSQIGLIAVNILGEYNKNNDNENINETNLKFADKLEDEMIYDPQTLKRLKNLYKAKAKAIELEDFDEAKNIKTAIDRLKSVSQQLIQLEERKKIAIKNDDFDAAKILKYEIERLRNAVVGININDDNIGEMPSYPKVSANNK